MPPKLSELDDDVAEAVRLWRSYIEQGDEACGLWLYGPPRGGSSFAGAAAARSLGKLDQFKGWQYLTMTAHHAYEDLRSLWDADKTDSASFAEWASLDAEIHHKWNTGILLLDDWNDTVPADFVMRWFYPRIRDRLKAGKPTIIATRYHPKDVTGVEAQFFYDLFVVARVDRHAGR